MKSKDNLWLWLLLGVYATAPAMGAGLGCMLLGAERVASAVIDILAPARVDAANITVSFTNGQNNYAQGTLIPQENARKCAVYSRTHPSPGCVSADLVSPNGSCVAVAFTAVTLDALTYRDCTIYTQDAAGEALYHADQLYTHELQRVIDDLTADATATRLAWLAANQTARNNACSAISRPNGCHFF